MHKNIIIAVLGLIVLIMMLWPSKRANKNDNGVEEGGVQQLPMNRNESQGSLPNRMPLQGRDYVCPAPSPAYNPQYPNAPNPWYVTPQLPPNATNGQPVFPQQSSMPNYSDTGQYYFPSYRFRNPNNNESRTQSFSNNTDNTMPSTNAPYLDYSPYAQPMAPVNPPRYTPPQFQNIYPNY